MNSTVIKVEAVSKQYRLGTIGTGSFAHDLNRWWHVLRGKNDPYLKIGEENDRTKKNHGDYVWALRDVSFEVKKGEVLGIIGRNGAGKSTLLKILSRTTLPTLGNIKVKGRIASLLEVGTGFHPELTGRENIFLNGAILGMSKNEIRRKFDEIVEFSGVEKYIDTPVKRYSSGMYVRLAFGVAAHLEPEILIIDEVLAVGDMEFQKKCLGKMDEVAHRDGRTVIFVSHNMAAIRSLCNSSILMTNGRIEMAGSTEIVASRYLKGDNDVDGLFEIGMVSKNEKIIVQKVILKNQHGKVSQDFEIGDDLIIELHYKTLEKIYKPYFVIAVKSKFGFIFGANALLDGNRPEVLAEDGVVKCVIKSLPFLPQQFILAVGIRGSDGQSVLYETKDVGYFNILTKVSDIGFNGSLADSLAPLSSPVLLPYSWQFDEKEIIEIDHLKKAKRTSSANLL